MTTLTDNLDAFWISKLGTGRLSDLTESGADISEKALAVVRSLAKDRERFYGLLFEGFDGYFHQSVYARRKTALAGRLRRLQIGEADGRVEWWSRQSEGPDRVRVLAGVRKDLEFLAGKQVVTRTIPIPAMAEVDSSKLRARILTVQSKPETWSKLLNENVDRLLTPIKEAELCETLYDAISPRLEDFGKIQNLSSVAVKLMKDTDHVLTFSGTFGVKKVHAKVGRTRHITDGRLGKRSPMHEVMKAEFDELVNSDDIRHCEIVIKTEHHGLIPGTALVFFPDEGKIGFRRMLGKEIINDFLGQIT